MYRKPANGRSAHALGATLLLLGTLPPASAAAVPTFRPPTSGGQPVHWTFPATGDTATIAKNPHIWTKGDTLEGVRQTNLSSASSLTGVWQIDNQLSEPGILSLEVFLNDVRIGTLAVMPTDGATAKIDLRFPPVQGPKYTLRYVVTEDVSSGAGSVNTKWDTSKLTLK